MLTNRNPKWKKLSWVINLNQVGPPKCVEQALDRLHAQVKPFLCLKIWFVIGFCWLNSNMCSNICPFLSACPKISFVIGFCWSEKRCAIICVPSSQLFQRIGHGYRVLGDEALYARFYHIFMQGFIIFYHIFCVTRRSRRDAGGSLG